MSRNEAPEICRRTVWIGRHHRRVLGSTVLIAGIIACTVASPALQTVDQPLPANDAGPLQAHLLSGELVVFDTWQEEISTRLLVGNGRRYDLEREPVSPTGPVRLPFDSIALLEVSRERVDAGYSLGLTLLSAYTVLTGTVAAVCVADPKSCFGSCPTFYIDDADGRERLVAEGFSSSVARALEASDLDDLGWRAGGGSFSIRMRNEALETHAVRSLVLHAVPEASGQRVYATPDGRFLAANRVVEATRCDGPEGDCREDVRAFDSRERRSWTDPSDLATRETIELEFPASGLRVGLLVGARHSFVTTFLFYQTLAFLGNDAPEFLAGIERGDGGRAERIKEVMGLLGNLEVSVRMPGGEWQLVGTLQEAGPLATDAQLLELPGFGPGPVRVRLNLTQGFWRLDQVAMVEIEEEVRSIVLEPAVADRLAAPGVSAGNPASAPPDALAALLSPDRYLITEPGDHVRITFELPEIDSANDAEPGYRLFLESTGYYYEWMRSEWLKEESSIAAAAMMLRPEAMFRALAPRFKDLEPGMEKAFWSSRFRRDP